MCACAYESVDAIRLCKRRNAYMSPCEYVCMDGGYGPHAMKFSRAFPQASSVVLVANLSGNMHAYIHMHVLR
jgi:hypothetical protein